MRRKGRRPAYLLALLGLLCVPALLSRALSFINPPRFPGRTGASRDEDAAQSLHHGHESHAEACGLDERDAAFMQRLRHLAQEALTWPHLGQRQRLVWAAALEMDAVPFQELPEDAHQELPPWFWERQNITRRHPGLDLLTLDGSHAVGCWNASVSFKEVRRFLRMARWVYKAPMCTLVTSSSRLPAKVAAWLRNSNAVHWVITNRTMKRLSAGVSSPAADETGDVLPLRQCQRDCLDACAKGARVIEMACGTGKTRVIQELVSNVSGRVLITVPLRALLDQFAPDFPGFCKVGTGHNAKIDFDAKGFIAVTDSVHLLEKLKFHSIFVDEGHHPLPSKMPWSTELYRLSATHTDEPDFRYTMGKAIEDGVLCDYDITVPALTAHHAYVCLADLLLKQAGRFRRVLAYCNSVAGATRFRMVLKELGLAAWHINGETPLKERETVIEEFAGPLQKPVHVLVTVEVLGEGINIPNADTCMFVEPRGSYRSIIQAIGRVLRHHPAKTLAHIVLPAVAIPNSRSASISQSGSRNKELKGEEQPNAREADSLQSPECQMHSGTPEESDRELPMIEQYLQARNPRTFGIAEDEVVSEPQPPDAISMIVAPVDTRRQAGRIHSNGQQRPEVRDNPNENLDLLQRQPDRNYDKPEMQTSPAARTDCQQDQLQAIGRSVASGHMHDPMQRLQEKVQNQYLDRFKPGTSDPTAPRRPGVLDFFGRGIDDDAPKLQETQATMSLNRSPKFKLIGSSRSPVLGQKYDNQLERFLATLTLADHRLVGARVGHRIQVVDCTLEDAGASTMEGWTTEIYNQLSAILSGEDHWETRFRELEEFVDQHGRLPSRRCKSHYESALGRWLNSQSASFRKHRLPLHRFQKLMSASSPLIRRRAKGWQTGDIDGRFVERCYELGEYVQLHRRLPASGKLARWLADVCGGRIRLDSDRIMMLQEVDPLVKAELQKWQNAPPLRRPQWERKFGQFSEFVLTKGRLPKFNGDTRRERRCYNWLRVQCRKLLAGCLPDDLAQQLRNFHPLVAEYIDCF